MKKQIKIGTKVKWVSSAQGWAIEKHGKVVAVIPAGERPDYYLRKVREDLPPFISHYGGGGARKEESYLVLVPVPGKTKSGRGRLYWPRTSALRCV